jgi:hypothetical protein
MKTTFTYAGVLTTVLAVTGIAAADTGTSGSGTVVSTAALAGGYADEGIGYGYHASTEAEGVLRGLGALSRSIGEANYYNSLAAINGQDAYTRYLQNSERRTETYFRMRQINRAGRQAERAPRWSYEQYVAMAKNDAPDNLTEQQYDRTLGRLNWPALLGGDEFAPEREALSRAFLVRSPSDTGAATAFYAHVQQLAAQLDAKLLGKIDHVTPAEYVAAKKFISGLAYESQQPLVVRSLAAR